MWANAAKASTTLNQLIEDQVSKLAAWLNADSKPAPTNVVGNLLLNNTYLLGLNAGTSNHMTLHLNKFVETKPLPNQEPFIYQTIIKSLLPL